LLAVATVCGVLMIFCTGITLLWIGLGGVLFTLLYPYMKYRALGDLVIAINYAWLPVWGVSFVTIGTIDYSVLIPAIPVGMITIAILHANNTRDVFNDANASISTLAMQLGHSMAAKLYAFWVLAPFVFVIICVATTLFPAWTLLSLFAFPVALSNAKTMLGSSSDNLTALSNLDERTSQLQLMFSALFSISFIIASFV
ncbi:MAG: prenyltransferase, partial [Muribaculaceae bacterium]|nr:prenyltransferase [Muribaculaceae bacterium]